MAEIIGSDTVEDRLIGSDESSLLDGRGFDDVLVAGAGDDTLIGGTGEDIMVGGDGNDRYFVDNVHDVVAEQAYGGYDVVLSSVSFTLSYEVEELTLLDSDGTPIDGSGNMLNNLITGNAAANVLYGDYGADTLIGGAGNDTYRIDVRSDGGDLVVEEADGGIDTVIWGGGSYTYQLPDNVENLVWQYGEGNAIGNALANVITGNEYGNILDGRAGADTMIGGGGSDYYIVDDIGDVVTEYGVTNGDGGYDSVSASVDFSLAGLGVENLYLTGTAITATGNALDNTIDTIGTGNVDNVIDGGAGIDYMSGGKGNDTYYVDNAGDTVYENFGGGDDIVIATVDYVLPTNEVESLQLAGSAAINGTGNSFANLLTGNDAANVLDGMTGADTMIGGAGNDTYYVQNSGDVVKEVRYGGYDKVFSSVTFSLTGESIEALTLTGTKAINGFGNSADNTIEGNDRANALVGAAGDDILRGGGGNDTLEGGSGRDAMRGGSGADHFVFAKGDSATTAAAADRIADFSHAQGDRIDLSRIDADRGASGDQSFVFIGTSQFSGEAGELRTYTSSGHLYASADTNGDGKSDFLLRVDGASSLVATDFIL